MLFREPQHRRLGPLLRLQGLQRQLSLRRRPETRGLSFLGLERRESYDQEVGYAYVDYREREQSCPTRLSSWSRRTLGKVDRNNIIKTIITRVFSNIQNSGGRKLGPRKPPRYIVVKRAEKA